VLLFHGLEGSSDSHYARAPDGAVQARGWHGAIPHFRGCSGEPNLAPRFYHSGDAEELDWIIRRLRPRYPGPSTPPASRWAAMPCCAGWAKQQHGAEIVDAAVAISAPLDLAAAAQRCLPASTAVHAHVPGNAQAQGLAKLERFPGLFDRAALLAARDLYSFDNVVTAPLHGYRDTDDYWHRASARHVLHDITVPTLVLNARNDPFLPGRHLPQTASRAVTLEYPTRRPRRFPRPAPSPAGSTGCRAHPALLRRRAGNPMRAPAAARTMPSLSCMDDIVKQAMAKWPNVPHCYGWLALDARGTWRMRDEAAQRADAPGDKLNNPALVGFINRNYQHDERGCWYFQNGPQRVYVNLEATPFIARTDPAQGLVLHTGAALGERWSRCS
jgi:hypothetical protein